MNKKTFTTKRKAFSLIELSIVLIIIGLLIAGVTGGASLIKNAELRNVINEARGYQTVVNSFYSRFNALPGDYGTAIGGTNNSGTGNNNGRIEFVNVAAVGVIANRNESNNAWLQLQNANFIPDLSFAPATDALASAAGGQDLTAGATSNGIPGSKMKSSGWTFDYASTGTLANLVILNGATIDAVANDNCIAVACHPALTASLTPVDALSIDTKNDDGIAGTGAVRGMTTSPTTDCTYTSTNTAKACTIGFALDTATL